MPMKGMGYMMLIGGFLAGAFATALHIRETNWAWFIPGALIAAIGVLLLKREAGGIARSEQVLSNDRVELGESLDNIVRVLDQLAVDASISGAALRDAIDDRLRNDLRRFAEARQSLVHLFSLQTYADVMSEFAAGERYINRVWSASADGYDDEARVYLQRAAAQFRDARNKLQAAAQESAP